MTFFFLCSAEINTSEDIIFNHTAFVIARILDYAWVLETYIQCVKYGVPFSFHQTGNHFRKGGKLYHIGRKDQHDQAKKANLDFISESLLF